MQSPQSDRQYSDNTPIHKLIERIVGELKAFTEDQAQNISDLVQIGKAMSAEHDLSKVLEMILGQARRFTKADGGTLYLLTDDRKELEFYVMHNDTLNSYMGGTSEQRVSLPNVPLYVDDQPNQAHVSAFVALNNKAVNISDVYQAEGFNFEGTKKFDNLMKYRSQSMLVVPMCDHEDQMIGVLQLINAKDSAGQSIPFSIDAIDLTEALSSQAAVMLTQQNLINNLKDLFESFIKAIATAIEEKSNYTGGHIQRVAELTIMIAEEINQMTEGPFAEICFSMDELEELRIAAWMHDTGKITTAGHIVDKALKLEGVFNKMEHIKTRWQTIYLTIQLRVQKLKSQLINNNSDSTELNIIDDQCQVELAQLADDLAFLENTNIGGEFMTDKHLERLNLIAQKTYELEGIEYRYLNEDEVENLSIRKGTLTKKERDMVENHATMTMRILERLPWPRKLSNVPKIASGHHEKLDGSGYPMKYKAEQINLQSRIMAVSDIFEALSAPDRPYKKPMSLSQAIKVLGLMVKDNHLDNDVVELLINSELVNKYAKDHLNQDQLDM
ncbi:MAG: GAF domain-containing protein [SAR324 cluster bacterium]|nr:GAF domain-containing protein [SAR324 cluster bacterium]